MRNLPDIIRKARLLHGMSQRDLASRLGVHYSAVGAWEVGTNQPAVAQKIALAQLFQLRFTDLMPEMADGVVLVTDPILVSIVRLIEPERPEVRAALVQVLALALEKLRTEAVADRPARKRRPQKAG